MTADERPYSREKLREEETQWLSDMAESFLRNLFSQHFIDRQKTTIHGALTLAYKKGKEAGRANVS
jgi:hypothetical protein